jgi:uncharacterized membrane protein YsdA (DUF1294 family)
MQYLYLYFLIVSLVSFVVLGCDKYFARNHKRRIPETILLTWSFIGGSVGTRIGLYGIILFQLLLVLALYYFEIIGIY